MPPVIVQLSEILRAVWPQVFVDFLAASVVGAIAITVCWYHSSVRDWFLDV